MTQTAVIFDMDGTLCDVSSIRHHVNPNDPGFSGDKRFDLFHSESIDCPPNQQAIDEVERARAEGHAVVVVTARAFEWRYVTMLWLNENGVEYDELYMRKDGDFRRDFEVKADILDAMWADGYEPVRAVDDNPSVIELWESEGIETVVIPGWLDPH